MSGFRYHVIASIVGAGLFAPHALAQEDPDLALMPEGAGRMETYYACVPCHSIKIVVQQGMDREGWLETIDWMVDEQGMEPLEASEQAQIVDYLAAHFGPDRPNFKR